MNGTLFLIIFIMIATALIRSRHFFSSISWLQWSRKTHFTFMKVYFVLLLASLIFAEILEWNRAETNIPKIATEEQLEFNIYEAITNHLPIPNDMIIEKRTHETNGHLTIRVESEMGLVLIERTKERGTLIEETIFKPLIFANDYQLSNQLQFKKPLWQDGIMRVPQQPINELEYVSYYDSIMLNRFTKEGNKRYDSWGSSSQLMMIYLRVPESVIIDADENNVEYLETIN